MKKTIFLVVVITLFSLLFTFQSSQADKSTINLRVCFTCPCCDPPAKVTVYDAGTTNVVASCNTISAGLGGCCDMSVPVGYYDIKVVCYSGEIVMCSAQQLNYYHSSSLDVVNLIGYDCSDRPNKNKDKENH